MKLIGTKKFYRRVFALMVPILLQNGITNFVSMLDNLMVGRVGHPEVTGVSVAYQLIFVFALCCFGAVSGAGIFGAQFFGSGNVKGLRDTFRFKLILCAVIAAGAAALFFFAGDKLSMLFLSGEGDESVARASLQSAHDYMRIMLISLLPFALVQCFSSTLRETGQTVLPMTAGIIAVFVNLALNYVLIFGHFGAPEMGVRGAAVATVVSRFAELFIVAFWTLRHREKNPFIVGAFRSLRVPLSLVRRILAKGLPLMLNETMWAGGMATVNRFYSLRGLDVVAANNINITFFNVFSVAFMSAGMSIGIILGQMLGAGETAKAKDSARKLIAFSVALSLVVAGVYAALSGVISGFYSVPDSVRTLATGLMLVCVAAMPLDAFANASYFTLRSGGQALITFIFDSGFVWAVTVPAAFIIQRFTDIPIIPMYAIVQGLNLLKCAVGYLFFRTGRWATNIVSEEKAEV